MIDYEKRFSELLRAVPFIADNEEEKANRFAVGLNPWIRAYVASAAHTQYRAIVEAATRVERSVAAIPRPKQSKKSWSGNSQGGSSKLAKTGDRSTWSSSGKQRQSSRLQSSQALVKQLTGSRGTKENWRSRPTGNKCGKTHLGECQKDIRGCYKCGQEGHFMRDCPNVGSNNRPGTRFTTPGQTSGSHGHQGGPSLEDQAVLVSPVEELVEEDHPEHS